MPSKTIVAIVLAAAAVDGCTCVGCGQSFSWSADLPATLTYADVRALHVRACRNDACAEADLDVLPTEERRGIRRLISLSDPDSPDAPTGWWVEVQDGSDGGYRVELGWYRQAAANGDRYLVEVTDPAGDVVAGLPEQAVDYSTFRANGPLDPEECRTITIEQSADASTADSAR